MTIYIKSFSYRESDYSDKCKKDCYDFKKDIAAKRHIKHKNEILHLMISTGYEFEIRKF